MSSLCQERWKRAAVLSPAVTPCLSLQAEKTDQALSRANTVAGCSHLASQETAFDGAEWRWGGPRLATAMAPASPAWLSAVLPGGTSTGPHAGAAESWGQSQSSPHLHMGSRHPLHWNVPERLTCLELLEDTVQRNLHQDVAQGNGCIHSSGAQLPRAQTWALHHLTGYLGQITESLGA